jgi:hypothetical protein
LLLENGRATAHGAIGDVLARYASSRGATENGVVELPESGASAVIRRISVDADNPGAWSVSQRFRIRTQVQVNEPGADFAVFLHLHDQNQVRVFSAGSFFERDLMDGRIGPGTWEFECEVPGRMLNEGEYSLDVMLLRNREEVIQTESAILTFRIHDEPLGIEGWNWPAVGVIRPQLAWSRNRID